MPNLTVFYIHPGSKLYKSHRNSQAEKAFPEICDGTTNHEPNKPEAPSSKQKE
jgi:hypothetical protein